MVVSKLKLRQKHILEDAEEIQTQIVAVKLVPDMTDSEVIYFMRESRIWTKKIEDLITDNRKLQVEALGHADLNDMAAAVDVKVKTVKTVKENKVAAIANEDNKRGLSSLCDNKHKASVVFPEPFKGHYGENVFKFREEITAAIRDSQVKKADQVRTLLKYLKGDAKSKVGDHHPSMEVALDALVAFYGNTNLIWMKCKEDFEQSFSGDIGKYWGELES